MLPPDLTREHRAEALPPEAHRPVAHLDAALMEQVLHVPQGEREANVEHDRQADDLGAGLEVAEWAALGHAWEGNTPPARLNRAPLTAPADGFSTGLEEVPCGGPT